MNCVCVCYGTTSQKYTDTYTWGEKIGEGSYGSVYKVTRNSDGIVLACKVMDLSKMKQKSKDNVKQELKMMRKLSGRHNGLLEVTNTSVCKIKNWICLSFMILK